MGLGSLKERKYSGSELQGVCIWKAEVLFVLEVAWRLQGTRQKIKGKVDCRPTGVWEVGVIGASHFQGNMRVKKTPHIFLS